MSKEARALLKRINDKKNKIEAFRHRERQRTCRTSSRN